MTGKGGKGGDGEGGGDREKVRGKEGGEREREEMEGGRG